LRLSGARARYGVDTRLGVLGFLSLHSHQP
jgi:hypothetical protein